MSSVKQSTDALAQTFCTGWCKIIGPNLTDYILPSFLKKKCYLKDGSVVDAHKQSFLSVKLLFIS